MVGQKMPFLNATLLLLGQLSEYLAQMPAQVSVQRLASTFRNENNVVLALAAMGSYTRPHYGGFAGCRANFDGIDRFGGGYIPRTECHPHGNSHLLSGHSNRNGHIPQWFDSIEHGYAH
jgi:hypothetical protein